jgi:hypothetical protein
MRQYRTSSTKLNKNADSTYRKIQEEVGGMTKFHSTQLSDKRSMSVRSLVAVFFFHVGDNAPVP